MKRLIVGIVGAWVVLPWGAFAQAPPIEKDHAEKMAKGLELFQKHVKPLFLKKCVKCHGPERSESEFDLTSREHALKGGLMGASIIPGDSKKSLLYRMVAHLKEPYMPYEAKKLPDEDIRHIAAWIDYGAPYDGNLLGKDASAWTKKVIPAEAKEHWAFRPLKRPELPKVKDPTWAKSPIDRFIQAKREAVGVAPNLAADRRTLIRRLYLGLLGVPPTPEAVDSFVNDPDPLAYDKLVDTLLQDPRLGERMARHWLDLVRFAESHGFEHDYDRPTAYHYRDFVIKAFNSDLPYNTFVKWQLAGDEYEPKNPLAMMATGFLAAGVHSTQITKNEVEKHRYDEMDDMLATTGTAMLGLTLGCARCHDHKYDPVPSRDYYQLLATFTHTVRSEVMLEIDPEGDKIRKAAFEREHAPYLEALARWEKERLPERLAEWEKQYRAQPQQIPWEVLELIETKAGGGVKFQPLGDGSVLATGKAPVIDTYTFKAKTQRVGIVSLRLEALSHPSMVKGGPGRGSNGNFALTDFAVAVQPASDPKAKPTPVKLVRPRSTFDQKGLGIAGALDADAVTSGWAIDPQFGKDHAAVFDFEQPIGDANGLILTITMKFQNNVSHSIGRPRLSISTIADAPIQGDSMPASIEQILRLPIDQRTAEQIAKLRQWYRTIDPEWKKLAAAEKEHALKAPQPSTVKTLVSTEGMPAVRLHSQGEDVLKETHFLRRGDPNNKEGVATMGFLQALMPHAEASKQWYQPPPSGSRTSWQRRAMAEWITDVDQGAGKLLARVIVNRLWQYHMGRGIVATPSDFGLRGEPPTHPELLEFLAEELVQHGWSLKHIHRLILTSATYQQTSTPDEAKMKVDRENKLFWRKPSRRLEAEVIRDSILSVGGILDTTMFGPGTLDTNSKRRSIYFTVKRSRLIPAMIVFDAPDGTVGVGERPSTTIAPQALHLMNDRTIRNAAQGFASRVYPDEQTPLERAVEQAYRIALARKPTADETADAVAFLKEQSDSYRSAGKTNAMQLAMTDFCQAVICLNEFVYLD